MGSDLIYPDGIAAGDGAVVGNDTQPYDQAFMVASVGLPSVTFTSTVGNDILDTVEANYSLLVEVYNALRVLSGQEPEDFSA